MAAQGDEKRRQASSYRKFRRWRKVIFQSKEAKQSGRNSKTLKVPTNKSHYGCLTSRRAPIPHRGSHDERLIAAWLCAAALREARECDS